MPGPLEMVDRAFSLARHGGASIWGPSLIGGATLCLLGVTLYYLEFVEGIRSLRLPLAIALAIAWWLRAALLSRAARVAALRLAPELRPEPGAGHPLDLLRSAAVVGGGLLLWLCLPAAGSLLGPLGLLLPLPLLALRGAIAPSWLARSGMREGGGFSALLGAAGDAEGRRVAGILVELCVLIGALGLLANLYALSAALLLLARSYAGLSLALVEGFLSPQNSFVWVLAGSLSLLLLEPMRACLSAVAYVDARARREGLDLRAAIEEAIEASEGGRGRAGAGAGTSVAAALLLVALAGASVSAQAQVPPPPPSAEAAELGEAALALAEDDRVRGQLREILTRPEFREFEDGRGEGLRALLRRLYLWALRRLERSPSLTPFDLPPLPLPGAGFFLTLGGLLLLGVALFVLLSYRRRGPRVGPPPEREEEALDPLSKAPAEHLLSASELAARGRRREALRALYLATLSALDRRGRIAFDPAKTNWQYLRSLADGPERRPFAGLTRAFDRAHYGGLEVSEATYERCRGWAEAIVSREGAPRREAA